MLLFLFSDVNTTHPDKKSIMTYVMCLFQVLPHDTVDMQFADPSYVPAIPVVRVKQVRAERRGGGRTGVGRGGARSRGRGRGRGRGVTAAAVSVVCVVCRGDR